MKILRFIMVVLILNTFSVNAQISQFGTLKGKVVDKLTKQSIPLATIFIAGAQMGVSCDTSGVFVLKAVPEGVYSIVVSVLGFQEKTVNDVLVKGNKVGYLEVEIEEAAIGINEVTVKAYKYENSRLSPISNYGFSREEISRNPGAQGDIFRAIGMLPGVSSSGGEYSAIAVRGQGTRDNVYMVDDIPVTEVGHLESGNSGFNDPNGGRFSIFAPRVIDNAEFIGGGFGAQYGRRSASYLGLGIKEGNAEDFSIDGQVDLMGLTVNYDGPSYALKNTSLFLSARYQNLQAVENIADLKDLGLPKYQDFIFKSTSQLGAKNKLSVIAIYSPETFVRTTNNVKEDKELNSLFLADIATSKTILGVNLRTLVGSNSYMKNILYYTNTDLNNSYGNSFPATDSIGHLINGDNIPFENGVKRIKYSESKIGFRSIHSVRFENNSQLTTGIDLDRVDLSNYRNLSKPDTSYVIHSYGLTSDPQQYFKIIYPQFFNVDKNMFAYNSSVYANYSFLLLSKLSINAGVRYDYSGFANQQTISPRLNGSYQLNESSSLNFATGIFYQDPIYSEIADQPTDKKLKEEKTIQFIVGYKKYFSPDLKMTIEGWYKKFDDMIVRPVAGEVEQNNAGSGYASGIDFNLTKRLTEKIHGQVGYSFMQSKRNDNNGQGEYDFTFSQPHQVNFLISYKPNKRWILATKFRYATGKPTDRYVIHNNVLNDPQYLRYSQGITGKNQDRLPDFISLDVRADYRFNLKQFGLTAFIDIVDILNRQNVNGQSFNAISGKTFYDGISIFPTFGIKFQL